MSVVSEGDVMDVLLTWFLVFCVVNPGGESRDRHPEGWSTEIPMDAWEVAKNRLVDGGPTETLAALAASEGRLELESAKESLLWAVLDWSDSSFLEAHSKDTRKAVARLRRALEGK